MTTGDDLPLAELAKLSHAFGNTRVGEASSWAVRDVDLAIERGETLGLVGESGSGKSTLGRCLLRLMRPTRGRVLFAGQEITGLRPHALRPFRRRMQIVFQDPAASLNPRLTVREMLREPLRVHRLAPGEGASRIAELLAQVGLDTDALDRFPHQFSGGQRQRLCIARALIVEPELIVADEPTSALDVSVRAQVLNLLLELKQRHRLTYLFISHDLQQVRYLSDRIAVMFAGSVVELGPAHTMLTAAQHPYTRALLAASRVHYHRLAPESCRPEPIDEHRVRGCAYAGRCPLTTAECLAAAPTPRTLSGHRVACHRA